MVRLIPSAICLVSFLGEERETAARNNTYTSIRYECTLNLCVFLPLILLFSGLHVHAHWAAKGTLLHVYLATLYVLSSASNIILYTYVASDVNKESVYWSVY
jgi:hypothetical protein